MEIDEKYDPRSIFVRCAEEQRYIDSLPEQAVINIMSFLDRRSYQFLSLTAHRYKAIGADFFDYYMEHILPVMKNSLSESISQDRSIEPKYYQGFSDEDTRRNVQLVEGKQCTWWANTLKCFPTAIQYSESIIYSKGALWAEYQVGKIKAAKREKICTFRKGFFKTPYELNSAFNYIVKKRQNVCHMALSTKRVLGMFPDDAIREGKLWKLIEHVHFKKEVDEKANEDIILPVHETRMDPNTFPQNYKKYQRTSTSVNALSYSSSETHYTDKSSTFKEDYLYYDQAIWAHYPKKDSNSVLQQINSINPESFASEEEFEKAVYATIVKRQSLVKRATIRTEEMGFSIEDTIYTAIFDDVLAATSTLEYDDDEKKYQLELVEKLLDAKYKKRDNIPSGETINLYTWSAKNLEGAVVYSEKINFSNCFHWPEIEIWTEYTDETSAKTYREVIGKINLDHHFSFDDVKNGIRDIAHKRVNDTMEILGRLHHFDHTPTSALGTRIFKRVKEAVLKERNFHAGVKSEKTADEYYHDPLSNAETKVLRSCDLKTPKKLFAKRKHTMEGTACLLDKVFIDSSGTVFVKWGHNKSLRYKNKICNLFPPSTKQDEADILYALDHIATERSVKIAEAINNISQMGIRLQDGINSVFFFNLMSRNFTNLQQEVKLDLNESGLDAIRSIKISGVICTIEDRMMLEYFIWLNIFHPERKDASYWSSKNWCAIKNVGDRKVICDYEMPLEGIITRLLLINPYSKIPYPLLSELLNKFYLPRMKRPEFLDYLNNGHEKCGYLGDTSDYELYYENDLVYKKKGESIEIKNPERFQELIMPVSYDDQRAFLAQVIDEDFINRAVDKEYIPADMAFKLVNLKGKTLEEAYHSINHHGNSIREREIRQEIENLKPEDRLLYGALQYLYEYDFNGNDCKVAETWFLGFHALEKLPNERPQTWERIKKLFYYLDNQVTIDDLKIDRESGPEYLKMCKMLDYAAAAYNCMRREKVNHSTHTIREKIVENYPELTTIEAFSRPVSCDDLSEFRPTDYSKFWEAQRAARQAKAVVNLHVNALAYSKTAPGITGARGNTGAGKSIGLEDHPGILNPDSIKWPLREDTEIRNKQVHPEGSMLFGLYFGEMSQKEDFRYTTNKRLIDLDRVYKYVINPAKEKGCPAIIKDLDAPLIASLMRVLTRDPRGVDPCPALDAIVDGYKGIRKHRGKVITAALTEEIIEEYRLTYLGEAVAIKKNDDYEVLDEEKLAECLRVPTDEEIEAILNLVIDEALIEKAVTNKYIYDHQSDLLKKWIGCTLRDAVNKQAEI